MRPFILSTIFSLTAIAICAQGYVDILPEEVTKPYYTRRDAIVTDTKVGTLSEWVGWYSIDVGETWSQGLLWSPNVGFVVFRDTCSNGPRAWVNYGRVSFDGQSLTLLPDRREREEYLLELPEKELMPIRWDQQHWLIPKKDLALFAYAINSRAGIEHEIGYIKGGDVDKRRRGAPGLPKEFRKLLGVAPIDARVTAVHDREDDWFPTMTIDAGRNKGIIEGMSFWLTWQKSVDLRVTVSEVGDRMSKVVARSVGRTADFEKEVVPIIGWRFTNRFK